MKSARIFYGILLLALSSLGIIEAKDPSLIDIKTLAPGIILDIRYATTNNFTHQKLYDVAQCLLCEPVAQRLARVQSRLEKEGLGLKVWDCYRPVSVQKKLWAVVPDPRFVANPAIGSKHNRGASVDLTLVDRAGRELVMPTAFDEFTDAARRDFNQISDEARRNREKLEQAMGIEGFLPLPTEWWHFDDPEWLNYALRDEPLGTVSLATDLKTNLKPFVIPRSVNQLVLVVSDAWRSPTARLRRFERGTAGWTEVGSAWPVTLGSKGLAWGYGLNPHEDLPPQKKEGDKAAPAGVFRIGNAYGKAASLPFKSSLAYQQLDDNWYCVDDPSSPSYNRILRLNAPSSKNWSSSEALNQMGDIYKWIINVEQNYPDVRPGCGSCIFLHLWRNDSSPTDGCTAMSEENLLKLLEWLDPQENPVLVQLPRDVYTYMKKRWKLP